MQQLAGMNVDKEAEEENVCVPVPAEAAGKSGGHLCAYAAIFIRHTQQPNPNPNSVHVLPSVHTIAHDCHTWH